MPCVYCSRKSTMSRYRNLVHLFAFLSSVSLEAIAINRTDFFGERTSETPSLVQNDDDSSSAITLSVPYPFFDRPRSLLYVSLLV